MAHLPIPKLNQKQIERFWSRVNCGHSNDCWNWLGWLDVDKYGQISFQYKTLRAHRIAYFLHNKKDPGKLSVCHLCDNAMCCNPFHLWLGTPRNNNQDCSLKGRYINQKGIKNPSAKLTEAQVRQIRKQYAEGRKQCELVSQHSIHPTTIHNIVQRKTWTHI